MEIISSVIYNLLVIASAVVLSALARDEQQNLCTLWSRNRIPIQGVKNVSSSERQVEFCSFYRIPYAKAPVNKFRFQKAQLLRLVNAKSKPLAFKTLSPSCWQTKEGGLIGQEDCLFANVFTRRGIGGVTDPKRLHPVVVWIHGGTFSFGSGLSDNFNPSAFVEEDIVVVSFNYRLDLLGFFPVAADEPYAMNLGLDDQKVVLKWIRKHIKIFGGDPNRVTLMGWSAGSASVNYLLYDQEAKGLFHSAISMSGSFLSPWAFTNYALRMRQQICDAFSVRVCSLDGVGVNITSLFNLAELYRNGFATFVWGTPFPSFTPAPQYPGDSPELRMRVGPLNDVPLLIGVTSDETKNFYLGTYLNTAKQSTFVFPNDDPKTLEAIISLLRGIEQKSETDFAEHLAIADLYFGVYKFLELHSLRTEKNIYFYRLNYNPENGSTIDAAHGDDIKLLFNSYDEKIPDNHAVAKRMQKMWTDFVKHQ